MAPRKLVPVHPGEVLTLDLLEPLGLSQYRLAKEISVPARRTNEIVHGTRAVCTVRPSSKPHRRRASAWMRSRRSTRRPFWI